MSNYYMHEQIFKYLVYCIYEKIYVYIYIYDSFITILHHVFFNTCYTSLPFWKITINQYPSSTTAHLRSIILRCHATFQVPQTTSATRQEISVVELAAWRWSFRANHPLFVGRNVGPEPIVIKDVISGVISPPSRVITPLTNL